MKKQEEYLRKRQEVCDALKDSGLVLSLEQAAKLLPDNPEWDIVKRKKKSNAMSKPLPKLPLPPDNVTIRENEDRRRNARTGKYID